MEFNYNTYTILRVVHPAPGNRNRQLATGTWQPEPGTYFPSQTHNCIPVSVHLMMGLIM